MDHEAYENEMIDFVNRNAEEKSLNASTLESKVTARTPLMNKMDANILKLGLKRMLIAIITAALFFFSVCGFIAVATATGYLAVFIFLTSIVAMVCAFIFLYAQGITRKTGGES